MRMKSKLITCTVILACLAGSPIFARTMSVTAVDTQTATLAFGEADGKAYTLCVASGETDGGSDKRAWTTFTRGVATIAADQTEYVYELPASLVESNGYFRFFLLQTDDLPYERELEWIASSGTQYIDTGVIGKDGTAMECDVAHLSATDNTLIGSRKSSGATRFFLGHVCRGKWGIAHNYYYDGSVAYVTGQKTHLSADYKTGKQTLLVDGVSAKVLTDSTALNTGINMYLFAANLYGTAKQFLGARLWNMTITQDGTLVRSFLPVVADGAGALYDTVSGTVFANKGSGSFTLGEIASDEANRRGVVKAFSNSLKLDIPSREILLTMPWQQNVYTNRFTIMCEAKAQTDGLQLQYGAGYAQRVAMTYERDAAGTYIYKARVTLDGQEGAEIPYRIALSGVALSGEGTNSTAGIVKLWKSSETDFRCAIWGDNQQGARTGDWDSDKFQYLRAIFNHMLDRDVDFGICTGDTASSANYETQIRPCNLDTTDAIFGRVKPYYMAWGNHDTSYPNNKPYFETSAIDDPDYQSSTKGNAYLYRGNTLLILLDDQLCQTAATKTWLANLLATPRAQAAAFRLVYHHQPVYTEVSGSQLSFLRQTFIDGKVDIVFTGHMHGYERIHKDGVVYLVNGCLGYLDHDVVMQHNWGDDTKVGGHIDLPYLWARQKSTTETNVLGAAEPVRMGMLPGYGELAVTDNKLVYKQHAFNADGSYTGVCDSFELTSKTAAATRSATTATDPVCADPSGFAAFTAKPVTNAKWKEFADAVGLAFTYADGADDEPVVNVSKTDIMRFLAWLNGTTGTYRLPTVAELESAFGGQLQRTVSEWTSTVDAATGRCRILGSPAKAVAGTWARAADRPSLMTAECHADYVGFRLATGAAPAEPADPFAAPLAALAQLAEPAAVYKWEGGKLVDVSSEWSAEGPATLTYAVPVIFTESGDLSFAKSATLAGGFAAPKASSLTLTGALRVETRVAIGSLPGSDSASDTGFALAAGETLTLANVTAVGSCFSFKSGDNLLRLAGSNDWAGADLAFADGTVTNLAAEVAGTSTTLKARSLRQYKQDAGYNFVIDPEVSVTLAADLHVNQARYWINGSVDAAAVTLVTNWGPFFFGSGTLQAGYFTMCGDSWIRWGVSNIVFTSVQPFHASKAQTVDRYQIEGPGVRVRATGDWVLPRVDTLAMPYWISTAHVLTETPYLIVDTLDPDGTTAHTVTLAPTTAEATAWGLVKESAGTLVLDGAFNQQLPTRVNGGTLRLAEGTTHPNAEIVVGSAATLALEGTAAANIAFENGMLVLAAETVFTGSMTGAKTVSQPAEGVLTLPAGTVLRGTMAFADGTDVLQIHVTGVTAPGDYLVLESSGLTEDQIFLSSDSEQTQEVLVDAAGTVVLRVIPTGSGETSAFWTNAGAAGDVADAANWEVYDDAGNLLDGAVPDETTDVYLGGAPFSLAETSAPNWRSVHLTGRLSLASDLDWARLGAVTAGANAILDLKGHTLAVGTYGNLPGEVTDSTPATVPAGVLQVTVPDTAVLTNASVRLTGHAKLAKRGTGTLVIACSNQTYTAGTEVQAGLLTTPVSGSTSLTWSARGGLFGVDGSTVRVQSGATFDLAGNYGYNTVKFVLAGGTLRNSGADQTQTGWDGLSAVALTADSVLQLDNTLVQNNNPTIDLGGHALDVRLANGKYWFLNASTWTNGTVRITLDGTSLSTGIFQTQGFVDAATVNFDFSCKLEVMNSMRVRDFTPRYEGACGLNLMEAVAFVTGTFTPVSDYFCNIELQDGATLDLSAKTETWSTTSLDAANGRTYALTAAEGATVTVKVAGRTFTLGQKVVDGASLTGTAWQWDETSAQEGVLCFACPNGIYWGRDPVETATVLTAHWTGAADNDLANPSNWVATNFYGEAVAAVPGAGTTVYLKGSCAPTAAADAAIGPAAAIVCDDVHLAADCDWRALGAAVLSGDINVNGHVLRVTGLAGKARITDRPLAVSGYEPLAWIQSDGSNYLDTGVLGNVGVSADAQVMCLSTGNTDACILGSRLGTARFILLWNVNTAPGLGYGDFIGGANYGGSSYGTFNRNTRYQVVSHMCDGRQTSYIDGGLMCKAAKTGTIQTGLTMWIFACNKDSVANWPITARLYGLRLFDVKNELIRSFVPARRLSDNAIGLYDTVEGVFHERKGTNAFTAGDTVTATPGSAGELRVDVAKGTTNINEGVSLGGGLKLVKAGRGTLQMNLPMQSYTGGTRVVGGSFIQNAAETLDAQPLGVDAPQVVIDEEDAGFWAGCRAFGWTTDETSATYLLGPSTKRDGFWSEVHEDGIYLNRYQLLIIR